MSGIQSTCHDDLLNVFRGDRLDCREKTGVFSGGDDYSEEFKASKLGTCVQNTTGIHNTQERVCPKSESVNSAAALSSNSSLGWLLSCPLDLASSASSSAFISSASP